MCPTTDIIVIKFVLALSTDMARDISTNSLAVCNGGICIDVQLSISNRDNSPLSEWIAYGFDITVLLVTERKLVVFVKEANAQ